jgi:hypothetical protein
MNHLLIAVPVSDTSGTLARYGQAMAAALRCKHSTLRYLPGKEEGAVLAQARQEQSDLILTSLGQVPGFRGRLRPPQGLRFLPKAHCPVLMIPEDCSFQPWKHLLYATRFEEKDARVPPFLGRLSELLSARLSCLFINPRRQEEQYRSRHPVLEAVTRLENDPSNIFFYQLHHRDVSGGITLFLQSYPTDAVAVLPRRRPAYAWRFGNRLTRHLAARTRIPLLAVVESPPSP